MLLSRTCLSPRGCAEGMAASACTRGHVALISPQWAQLVQLFSPISYRYSGKKVLVQFKFTPMLAQLSGSSLEHENHAVLTALPALVPQTRRSEPWPRCSSRCGCEQNPGVLQAARAGNICSAGPPLGCGGGRKMLHKCSRGWGWRLGQAGACSQVWVSPEGCCSPVLSLRPSLLP